MKIRLEGTREETKAAADLLAAAGFTVTEISRFYPNRGSGNNGRVYVSADLKKAVMPEGGKDENGK